jgi:hypothetical protein
LDPNSAAARAFSTVERSETAPSSSWRRSTRAIATSSRTGLSSQVDVAEVREWEASTS